MRGRLHVHNLQSQQICRSVPCSSVWGREAVMVCRVLLQTRRLPCTLLFRSSKKCSSFEFSQNAITSYSDSSSWTVLSPQTLLCRAALSDNFTSSWNETWPSFPIYVSTHTDVCLTRRVASTVKHSNSLNGSYFHFNLVEEATRTSLADTFGLNRELLENTLLPADWIHWPVGPHSTCPGPTSSAVDCSSVLKKRRKKMNRHKYKKWRKKHRFLRRRLKR